MARKIIILTADILLWCALCALLAAGFSVAGAIGRMPSVSLRYDSQISGKAAYNARLYSIEHADEGAFWPTFWREDAAELDSGLVTVSADCIVYSGDVKLVWPAEYLTGTFPGVTDGAGCAVSSALAWTLWGGSDVVGMTVTIDGAGRVVRGVFDDTRELALIPYADEDTTQSYGAVELSGGAPSAAHDDAESFAAASGLGRPDAVLLGEGATLIADFLAALPLVILAVYALALILALLRRRYAVMRLFTPYVVLLSLAALLPSLLGLLPDWMIPPRWSDFAFWSSLAADIRDGVREFLSVTPGLRDVDLRFLLIKQSAIALLSLCLSLCVCFRWHMRHKTQNTSGGQNG